ncbi:MAG: hypothetical protein ACI4DZ_03585 [Oliverpabstia sp.]
MCEYINKFREQLRNAGFDEASQRPFYFWKILTDKTAFIINLKNLDTGIGIVYGVRSTAVFWSELDWQLHSEFGTADDDCNLRYYLEINNENDEFQTNNMIRSFYNEYCEIDKDTLLKIVKEHRKQFIQQITNILKPLGFRRKGNQWRKHLSGNIVLQFWADKDPYTDLYYFEIDIFSQKSSEGIWCYSKRLQAKGTEIFDFKNYSDSDCRFDWQLQSTEDLEEIVNQAYKFDLLPFINNDLLEIGKQPFVWEYCICPRDCCESCWIEKNL